MIRYPEWYDQEDIFWSVWLIPWVIRYPSKTKCNDRLSRSLQTEIKSATQRTIPNPSKQWIQYPGLYKLCLGTSDPSLHIIKGQVLHPPFLNITLGLGKAPFTNLPDVRLLLNDLGELWSVFLVGPGASALSRTLPLRWHGMWTDQISLSQAEKHLHLTSFKWICRHICWNQHWNHF